MTYIHDVLHFSRFCHRIDHLSRYPSFSLVSCYSDTWWSCRTSRAADCPTVLTICLHGSLGDPPKFSECCWHERDMNNRVTLATSSKVLAVPYPDTTIHCNTILLGWMWETMEIPNRCMNVCMNGGWSLGVSFRNFVRRTTSFGNRSSWRSLQDFICATQDATAASSTRHKKTTKKTRYVELISHNRQTFPQYEYHRRCRCAVFTERFFFEAIVRSFRYCKLRTFCCVVSTFFKSFTVDAMWCFSVAALKWLDCSPLSFWTECLVYDISSCLGHTFLGCSAHRLANQATCDANVQANANELSKNRKSEGNTHMRARTITVVLHKCSIVWS